MASNNSGLKFLAVLLIPITIVVGGYHLLTANANAMYLYNPHGDTLMVTIDDEQYHLSYREKLKIKVSQGKHHFKSVLNDSIIKDTSLVVGGNFYEDGGMINMSSESLYLWKEHYGDQSMNNMFDFGSDSLDVENPFEKQRAKHFKIVQIDSTYLIGNITEFSKNDILVTRDWYYAIDRQFEDEIETYDSSTSIFGQTIGKIFSREDALDYWNQNYTDVLE